MRKLWWISAVVGIGMIVAPLVSTAWQEERERPKDAPARGEREAPPPRRDADRPPQPERPGARGPEREGPPPRRDGAGPEGRRPDGPPPRRDGEGPEGRRPLGPGERRPGFEGARPEGERPDGPPGGFRRPGEGPMRPFAGPGMPTPERLQFLREADPEMHALVAKDLELERRSHEMAFRVRSAGSVDKERAREEITKVATEQFAARQERRELQLKRLQEQLEEMKEALEKRNQQKDEIIERRVNELLGKGDDLDF